MLQTTKTEKIREAMLVGDYTKAIAMASKFKRLPPELSIKINQANASRLSPKLYEQMGKDPADLHSIAVFGMLEYFTPLVAKEPQNAK